MVICHFMLCLKAVSSFLFFVCFADYCAASSTSPSEAKDKMWLMAALSLFLNVLLSSFNCCRCYPYFSWVCRQILVNGSSLVGFGGWWVVLMQRGRYFGSNEPLFLWKLKGFPMIHATSIAFRGWQCYGWTALVATIPIHYFMSWLEGYPLNYGQFIVLEYEWLIEMILLSFGFIQQGESRISQYCNT